MDLAEQIKIAYEQCGFAVIDVQPIDGTPLFEMEFIGPMGHSKKKICTFFAMIQENNQQGSMGSCQPQ